MTRSFKQRTYAGTGLTLAVLAVVKDKPSTVVEITDRLNCAINSVRTRLSFLESRHQVHHKQIPGARSKCFRWYIGSVDTTIVPLPLNEADCRQSSITSMNQRTIKAYASHSRRDPLVAALFGQAGSVQP